MFATMLSPPTSTYAPICYRDTTEETVAVCCPMHIYYVHKSKSLLHRLADKDVTKWKNHYLELSSKKWLILESLVKAFLLEPP